MSNTTVTITEHWKHTTKTAVVTWTAREGRMVIAQVTVPQELGMVDSGPLTAAIAKHYSISADEWGFYPNKYNRKRSDAGTVVPRECVVAVA